MVDSTGSGTLEQMQLWTRVIGQAQQMILEHAVKATGRPIAPPALPNLAPPPIPQFDAGTLARIQADFAAGAADLWQRFLDGASDPEPVTDKRFSDPRWQEHPAFDLIRQSYQLLSDTLLKASEEAEGLEPQSRERLRFATRAIVDAASPSNFPLTNPAVLEETLASKGENLLRGLKHMLADIERGQLTHADGSRFTLGENIAATPGKVIKETPLYQLIHYAPTTETVFKTPLIIFPPWINRFYILDLKPEKSFVKWAVDQGLSVFMVSWKSADASMKDVIWDDYVLRGQIDAIDTVRELLGVKHVHAIGYCVAGTTLAATLALLAARDEAHKIKSATFFTAQVDFSQAGDLSLFVDDEQLKLVESLSADGFLDGRYMAATFNLLRGRDLIWSYVVDNYLLGKDYAPFDLLHWNGDTTNLPAKWHQAYLTDLYRDNKLVQPGALSIDGTPIDLGKVKTPAYVQAGREDHIAPPESVWKLTEHFRGPLRFVLAGSGHIAGVVNPPAAGKYQYWTSDVPAESLEAFLESAAETKGSWWPDWMAWIADLSEKRVPVDGARLPGGGLLSAIEDAPGRYVRTR